MVTRVIIEIPRRWKFFLLQGGDFTWRKPLARTTNYLFRVDPRAFSWVRPPFSLLRF